MKRHPMLTYFIFSQLLAMPAFSGEVSQMSVDTKKNILFGIADITHPSREELPEWLGGNGKGDIDYAGTMRLCYADETQFSKFENMVLKPWTAAWKKKDTKSLTSFFAPNFKGSSFMASMKNGESPLKEVQIKTWNNFKGVDHKSVGKDLQKYLSQYSSVESVEIKPESYLSPKSDRNNDLTMKRFTIKTSFSIRGMDVKGNRREDRGAFELAVENTGAGYTITGLNLNQGMTVTAKAPLFAENSASLKDLNVFPRTEAIRRGGYALSLADYDNDGNLDMLVGSRGPLEFFKGDSSGKFIKDTQSGIDPLTYVKSAIWADFNNDGMKDLLIVRFVPEGPGYIKNSVVTYANLGKGKFEKKGRIVENTFHENAMAAAVGDFDNDGLLDIYVGYPGQKDFTTFNAESEDKIGVKTQGIYINKGNFSFEPKNMNEGKMAYERFHDHQRLYPHSSMAVDFDQDGSLDILVIDDRGNLSPIYRNNGKGGFQESASVFGLENRGIGMSVATSDFNNDGSTDFALTNVKFGVEERIFSSCALNWDRVQDAQKDLKFFQGKNLVDGKKFSEVSKSVGLSNFGDALAGLDFIDFNNDGHDDLYVVNGLWSGGENDQDITSEYVRAVSAKMYGFITKNPDVELVKEKTLFEQKSDTKSFMMDILMNGKSEEGKHFALGTKQRNRFFVNQKDGTFLELGYVLGIDSEADGYTVAKADINKDGAIDIILRNADPGNKDVKFPPVQIFYGNTKHAGNRIELKLIGSKSNRDAIGASVKMKLKDKSLTRQLIGNNGTVQSDKTLWFGLGNHEAALEVTVSWPSGNKTVIKNLKKGFHIIEEEKDFQKLVSK